MLSRDRVFATNLMASNTIGSKQTTGLKPQALQSRWFKSGARSGLWKRPELGFDFFLQDTFKTRTRVSAAITFSPSLSIVLPSSGTRRCNATEICSPSSRNPRRPGHCFEGTARHPYVRSQSPVYLLLDAARQRVRATPNRNSPSSRAMSVPSSTGMPRALPLGHAPGLVPAGDLPAPAARADGALPHDRDPPADVPGADGRGGRDRRVAGVRAARVRRVPQVWDPRPRFPTRAL